jgi:hypothetical protein
LLYAIRAASDVLKKKKKKAPNVGKRVVKNEQRVNSLDGWSESYFQITFFLSLGAKLYWPSWKPIVWLYISLARR